MRMFRFVGYVLLAAATVVAISSMYGSGLFWLAVYLLAMGVVCTRPGTHEP